jgi:hypothetical protein
MGFSSQRSRKPVMRPVRLSRKPEGMNTKDRHLENRLHRGPITLLFLLALAGGIFLVVTGDTSARVAGFLFVVISAGWLLDNRRGEH